MSFSEMARSASTAPETTMYWYYYEIWTDGSHRLLLVRLSFPRWMLQHDGGFVVGGFWGWGEGGEGRVISAPGSKTTTQTHTRARARPPIHRWIPSTRAPSCHFYTPRKIGRVFLSAFGRVPTGYNHDCGSRSKVRHPRKLPFVLPSPTSHFFPTRTFDDIIPSRHTPVVFLFLQLSVFYGCVYVVDVFKLKISLCVSSEPNFLCIHIFFSSIEKKFCPFKLALNIAHCAGTKSNCGCFTSARSLSTAIKFCRFARLHSDSESAIFFFLPHSETHCAGCMWTWAWEWSICWPIILWPRLDWTIGAVTLPHQLGLVARPDCDSTYQVDGLIIFLNSNTRLLESKLYTVKKAP